MFYLVSYHLHDAPLSKHLDFHKSISGLFEKFHAFHTESSINTPSSLLIKTNFSINEVINMLSVFIKKNDKIFIFEVVPNYNIFPVRLTDKSVYGIIPGDLDLLKKFFNE